MGCDIHAFIEYKKPDRDAWLSLGSEIRLDRHYGIFARLADVRNGWDIEAVAADRGIPDDLGYEARGKYRLYITEDTGGDSSYVTPLKAARWVANGSSKYVKDSSGNDAWVTDPDAHSESWCTPDELMAVVSYKPDGKVFGDAHEYRAVLAAMRSLEADGFEARLVFWFDN